MNFINFIISSKINFTIDFIWNKFTARSLAIQMITTKYANFITYILVNKIGLNFYVVSLILILL